MSMQLKTLEILSGYTHKSDMEGTAGSAAISFNETLIVPVIYNGKIIYLK